MAGANTPRQRMINLMYLVFISMMALNMGKEVLGAFGLMNKKLEASNQRSQENIEAAFQALEKRVNDKPDDLEAKESLAKSMKIKELSDTYYNYLEGWKKNIMSQNEEAFQKDDYQVMDSSDFLDEKFFVADGLKEDGQVFWDNYLNYSKSITELLGDDPESVSLKQTIARRFESGEDGKVQDREGNWQSWMSHNYEGFPYIAVITKMSQIQADIRQTEQEFYAYMLKGQLKEEISMKHYTTLLEQSKGAFYQNQTFDGAIVLGRKDKSTKPNRVDLSLDGRKLSPSEYEVEEGKIRLKFNTGGIGEHKIVGTLYYLQDDKEIPVDVNQAFTTIPRPNEAVISADKMNVVYRGVANPMTISMPGVPDNKITASAPGLSKRSGSSYMMSPGQGSEVNIVVTGEIDGQKFSSSKKFRIKGLPKPEGAILKTTGAVKLAKQNIAVGEISVIYDNFDFDLTTKVTSFRILVPGQPSVVVNGSNRVGSSPAAVAAVNRAKKGDVIQISEIRYSVAGYNGTPVPATPISIEVL